MWLAGASRSTAKTASSSTSHAFLPVNVAGGSPVLRIFWYRYWWNDARPHSWWRYGCYSWWYWEYAWWGVTWWWHVWWIWWHGHHWWWWSTWWADLNPVHQQ